MNNLIQRYLIYLKGIGIENKTNDPNGGIYTIPISVTGDERDRIERLSSLLKFFKTENHKLTQDDYSNILGILEKITDTHYFFSDTASPRSTSDKDETATDERLIYLIYGIVMSGMGKSQYMQHRIQGVST